MLRNYGTFSAPTPFMAAKPKASPKPLIIIPLGTLFVPNDQLAIKALFAIVGPQLQKLDGFLKAISPITDRLNKGELTVKEFNTQMIQIIKEHFAKEITVEQFNQVWAARYTEPKDLQSLTLENKKSDVVIYSFTNAKDEQIIEKLCRAKEIKLDFDNSNHISEIAGMKVYMSHVDGVDKSKLFTKIVRENYKPGRQVALFLGSAKPQQISSLKEKIEESNKKIKETAEKLTNIPVELVEHDPTKSFDFSKLFQAKNEQVRIMHKL